MDNKVVIEGQADVVFYVHVVIMVRFIFDIDDYKERIKVHTDDNVFVVYRHYIYHVQDDFRHIYLYVNNNDVYVDILGIGLVNF